METKTIRVRVRVSAAAARCYERASEAERRKLDALLDLKLTEAMRPKRSLEETMSEMSSQARQSGLTPEVLDDILREPEA